MPLHIDWIETFKIWWLVLKFFAPLIVLVIIVEFIKIIPDIIMERRSRKAGIYEIDQMSGREFEYRLKSLFQNLGYRVELKRGYKDHGADLILTGAKGARIAVQAKKLASRDGKIGAKVIGEALRGKQYYNCHYAMIITNQYFTEQAIEEAQKAGVTLWNRKILLAYLEKESKF